ncbi:MAG: carboxypeptidase regulatory-like domain-containing protein [Gammaproteobacteria bacterium]|nr:carboxypeptidase regulatory-like domain-containing protein [Gammaproteobacteria bacterium]
MTKKLRLKMNHFNITHRIFLVIVFLGLSGCMMPLMYMAEKIRGRVVDAETGEPLAGVVIVAMWIPEVMKIGRSDHGGPLRTIETVTAADGSYAIPRGVMFRPPLHTLDRQDPVLSVFKNGYMSLTLANNKNRNNLVRTSDWDKKTLKLKPVGGTPLRRQAGLLSHFGDGLRDQWRSCPRMMLALNKEMQRLISQGIDPIYTIGVPKIKNLLEMERDYLKGIENDY